MDEALASRLKQGERKALVVFAAEFGAALRGFFWWRGLPQAEAEDLAVDTVADIIVKIDHFEDRGQGSFTAWCFKTARNKLIDWYRRNDVRRTVQLDDIPEDPVDDTSAGTTNELADAVQRALASLPENDSEVVALRHFQPASSFIEIGDFLRISEGAARVRYHRAINRLAEALRSIPLVQDWLSKSQEREDVS